MKVIRRFVILSLFLVAFSAPLFGGLEVVLQINSVSKALVRGAELESPSVELTTLKIQENWLESDDRDLLVIFDREKDQVLTLQPKLSEYDSSSLFALFEFRAQTYRSVAGRENFGYRPEAVGTASSVVLVDHIFGFPPKDGEPLPVAGHTDEEKRWLSGDELLASWTRRGTDVPPEQMDMLVFWILQTLGGHPTILDDFEAEGRIPDILTFNLNDGQSLKTVELELVGVSEIPDLVLDERIKGLSRRTVGEDQDALVTLLDWILGGSGFAEAIISEGSGDSSKARTAFENGNVIEAILETVRVGMTTGDTPDLQLKEFDELIRSSRTATNLLSSLNASTEDQLAQAIQTFEVLADAFESQQNVLTVLTAESLARLGRFEMAEGAFRHAVLADPSLTIAYKNLGDLARSSGRFPLGWQCYDAFQLLAPGNPANEQVDELREAFLTRFPDFF